MTLAQVIRSGELDHYSPGLPVRMAEIEGVDAEIVAGMHCPDCYEKRMVARPFFDGRREPGNYRLFACCEACFCTVEL